MLFHVRYPRTWNANGYPFVRLAISEACSSFNLKIDLYLLAIATVFSGFNWIFGARYRKVRFFSFWSSSIFSYNPVPSKNTGKPSLTKIWKDPANIFMYSVFDISSMQISKRLFSLWIFSRILIMAVSGSVIWGVPSTETPNPKNDRSIFADLIKEEMMLLLYSFDSIDCNKSVAGFNSRTIQLMFSLSFWAISDIITVFPVPLTPVITNICWLMFSDVKASMISKICFGLSTDSRGLFPKTNVNGFDIHFSFYCSLLFWNYFTILYCFIQDNVPAISAIICLWGK